MQIEMTTGLVLSAGTLKGDKGVDGMGGTLGTLGTLEDVVIDRDRRSVASVGVVLDVEAAGNLPGVDIDNASRKVQLEHRVGRRLDQAHRSAGTMAIRPLVSQALRTCDITADVTWPKAFKGGVHGPDEIRAYWTERRLPTSTSVIVSPSSTA